MNNKYFIDGFTIKSNPSLKGGLTISTEDGNIVSQYFVMSRDGSLITNNYTEFLALYKTLEMCSQGDTIITDSQNSISWSKLHFPKKSHRKDLKNLARKINIMISEKNINLVYIARDLNIAGLINEECEYLGWESYDLPILYAEDYTFNPYLNNLFS